MSDDNIPRALILLLLLLVFAFSLAGMGASRGKLAKMALAWAAIFTGAFALISFRGEFGALGARLKAELVGAPVPLVSGNSTRVRMREDGHFWVTGRVNGVPVDFLVDSGATTTSIGAEVAAAAGLEPGLRRDWVQTANGSVVMPRVTAERFEINGLARDNLLISINPNNGVNVLGMNFLSGLSRWSVEGRDLILVP